MPRAVFLSSETDRFCCVKANRKNNIYLIIHCNYQYSFLVINHRMSLIIKLSVINSGSSILRAFPQD